MCGWVHGNLPTRIMHLDVCHSLLACMYAIECPFRPFSSIIPAYAGGSPHGLLLASWLVGSPLGVYLASPPHVNCVVDHQLPPRHLGEASRSLAFPKASGS